ncbi:MAG: carboxymuconolactone decarboxylase family protein [candidate division KSB1 bacterium]|nr:carboxymuconolactone decarboxylase family protein [candidate division KSB1 bacterium]MDZ7402296.1 carboxymuconolactone decarboxylase family protein [candidate division KSB1 bacterium]
MNDKNRTLEDRLDSFKKEFGKILEPVAFLRDRDKALTDAFLTLHEIALGDGAISRKHKLLMHAAITASMHDVDATAMHLTGALKAGATEQEIYETAIAVIPVAGMPAFGAFLMALKKSKE